MDVVVEQLTLHIGQVFRNIQHVLFLQRRNGLLNFLETPLRFQLGNGLLNLMTGSAPECPAAFVLIIVGHFRSEMSAPGVNHEKQPPVPGLVYLNKVVTASQRADAVNCSVKIDLVGTTELGQVDFRIERMGNIADFSAVGNLLPNQRIQLGEVNLAFGQFHSFHTTANIHAYHTWDDLVLNGHSGADGTAFTRMDIGHNADFTACKLRPVTNSLNLLPSRSFQLIGVANSSVVLPLNCYHSFSPFLWA